MLVVKLLSVVQLLSAVCTTKQWIERTAIRALELFVPRKLMTNIHMHVTISAHIETAFPTHGSATDL